jgi:flagella basal body P-ring formation protein FlgA
LTTNQNRDLTKIIMRAQLQHTLSVCLLISLGALPGTAEAAVDAENLRKQVYEYINTGLQQENQARFEIEVSQLDSRLKLAECSQPLNFQIHGSNTYGRVSIKASCQGSSPWAVFVPALIKRFEQVVVTKHPLMRGQRLKAQDLTLKERDVTEAKRSYFTKIQPAIGQATRRRLPAGKVLTTALLEPAKIVKKGDEVFIRASQGPISVQMPAVALSDGKLGQQIKVRNRSSNKTVRATVVAPGSVEVVM